MLSLIANPIPIKPNIAAVDEQHKLVIAQVVSSPKERDFTATKLIGIAMIQPIEIRIIDR